MVLSKAAPRFVVLGGAGAIGRIIVRDLFESNPKNQILIADFEEENARVLAKSYRSRRVTHAAADARYPSRLASVLRDRSVVIRDGMMRDGLTLDADDVMSWFAAMPQRASASSAYGVLTPGALATSPETLRSSL